MNRTYVEVDVFTDRAYRGNPLAVVVDGDGLNDEEMQRFANWTNLSETTFLVSPTDPEADYRVRIFTTSRELAFAGHPTLGSCHAWLANGGTPRSPDRVVQQCGIGLVDVRRDDNGRLAFAAPPRLRDGPLDTETLAAAAAAIGIGTEAIVDSAWIDNGPGWLGLLLESAAEVLALTPTTTDLKIGVIGPHPPGAPTAYEVRAFFPENGLPLEDPVTGSLNASAAQWLVETGRFTPPYVTSQGRAIGRDGRVYVKAGPDGQIWIGGDTVTCVEGRVAL
ncbi:MAG: PhzF family phenazine biosynthesis protein [Actinomycetia bacterium]|nr:PhzF family phenazine biosynthesis protein [Actinomycetes bacterium]